MGELNRRRRTVVLLALVAVLVVPSAVGMAGGQEATATEASNATATPTTTAAPTPTETTTAPPPTTTATPTPTPVPPPDHAGPYTLEELRRGGTAVENAPDSTRMLPNGEFMYLRKWPAGITSDGWEYMGRGDVYHADDLTFLVVHNGIADPIDATLVITYWQPKTRQVQTEQGVVTQEYAGNQTVQRKDITIDPGYDLNNVTMRSHYDANYRVTAWLEMDGEPVEGVRWRFNHQTNQASSQVPFGDSWSSFLGWFIPRFIGGGIGAVVLGISGAYRYVTRAGVSAEKGTGFWVIMSAFALGVAAIGWWQQVVALIVGAPILLNVPVFGLAFVRSAGYFESSKTVLVEDPHIVDVTDPMGDDQPAIADENGSVYRYIEQDDGIGIIKDSSRSSSLPSALARYFTGPATISTSEWHTAFSYGGAANSKIYVDTSPGADARCPECDNLLIVFADLDESVTCDQCGWVGTGDDLRHDLVSFTSASWSFKLPDFLYKEADDGKSLAIVSSLLGLAAVLIAGVMGYGLGSQIFVSQGAIYTVAAGFAGLAVFVGTARPNAPEASLNAAPPHASHAKAARLVEVEERKKWDTFEELEAAMAETDVEPYRRLHNLVERYRSETQDQMDRLMGESERRGRDRPAGPSRQPGVADDD